MTLEEMAADLRKAGWRVEPPLTQENCPHKEKFGSGGINTDGSGYLDLTCKACGKRWHRTMEAKDAWSSMTGALNLTACG